MPYPFDVGDPEFAEITARAVTLASTVVEPYCSLLNALGDCGGPAVSGPLRLEQQRGASYRRLAAAGYAVGMSKAMRSEWYEIALAKIVREHPDLARHDEAVRTEALQEFHKQELQS